MPEAFEACVSGGGRVRTVSGPSKQHGLQAGEYVKYCTLDGKMHRGHVHQKMKKGKTAATR